MRISEVAALAGVGAATGRYYERRGLIAAAPRTAAGYRQYGADAARRLRFIKHAQVLGFSLEEIRDMLELRADDRVACARVEATAREKLLSIRQRIDELDRLSRTLADLVHACEHHRPAEACPILLSVADAASPDAWSDAGGTRASA